MNGNELACQWRAAVCTAVVRELYLARESLQQTAVQAQDALRRDAVSQEKLQQSEAFAEYLNSSKSEALAAAGEALSELRSTTAVEIKQERASREAAERKLRSHVEEIEAASRERRKQAEELVEKQAAELAVIKSTEERTRVEAEIRASNDEVKLEQQVSQRAVASAVSQSKELERQLAEVNARLVSLEQENSSSDAMMEADLAATNAALLAMAVGLAAVCTAVVCEQAPSSTDSRAASAGCSDAGVPNSASPGSAGGKNRNGRIRNSFPPRTPPRTPSAAGGTPSSKQSQWAPQLDEPGVSSGDGAGGLTTPEERLFANLKAGGQVASASLQRILRHAGQLLGQHIAASPISPPGLPGKRKSPLGLLAHLEDIVELVSRPVWCDQLAQHDHVRLEELAALLAYVESNQRDGSCLNMVVDQKVISELLDCLELSLGGRRGSPRGPLPDHATESESSVTQLQDTVEQLTVQMSLMEQSIRDEYAEMRMKDAQAKAAVDANAVDLRQQVISLRASLLETEERHNAELKMRADAEARHATATRELEDFEARAKQNLANLELKSQAESKLTVAEASEAASKATLEVLSRQLGADAMAADTNLVDCTRRSEHSSNIHGGVSSKFVRSGRSPSQTPQFSSRSSPTAFVSASTSHSRTEAQLREILSKLTLQELVEEAKIAGVDVDVAMQIDDDWTTSEDQKEDMVELLVQALGMGLSSRSRDRGHQRSVRRGFRSMGVDVHGQFSPDQMDRINKNQQHWLERELADTSQALYLARESLQQTAVQAQDALRRDAVSQEKLQQSEAFAEYLNSSKSEALAAAGEALSELRSTTAVEIKQERASREAAERKLRSHVEEIEAASRERRKQAEELVEKQAAELAVIKSTEERTRVEAEIRASNDEVKLEQQVSQRAVASAVSQSKELERQLAEVNARLVSLEQENSSSDAMMEADLAATNAALLAPSASDSCRISRLPTQHTKHLDLSPAMNNGLDDAPPPALVPNTLSSSPCDFMCGHGADSPSSASSTENVGTQRKTPIQQQARSDSSSSSSEDSRVNSSRVRAVASSQTGQSDRSATIERAPVNTKPSTSRLLVGLRHAEKQQLNRFLGTSQRQSRATVQSATVSSSGTTTQPTAAKPLVQSDDNQCTNEHAVTQRTGSIPQGKQSNPELERRSIFVDSSESETEELQIKRRACPVVAVRVPRDEQPKMQQQQQQQQQQQHDVSHHALRVRLQLSSDDKDENEDGQGSSQGIQPAEQERLPVGSIRSAVRSNSWVGSSDSDTEGLESPSRIQSLPQPAEEIQFSSDSGDEPDQQPATEPLQQRGIQRELWQSPDDVNEDSTEDEKEKEERSWLHAKPQRRVGGNGSGHAPPPFHQTSSLAHMATTTVPSGTSGRNQRDVASVASGRSVSTIGGRAQRQRQQAHYQQRERQQREWDLRKKRQARNL
eukprot:COSAG02_NODE_677_length_18591_cov_105.949221_10_plen_1437_part_00